MERRNLILLLSLLLTFSSITYFPIPVQAEETSIEESYTSNTHRKCVNGEGYEEIYCYPIALKDESGFYRPFMEVFSLTYENNSFVAKWYDHYLKLKPFVMRNGKKYGLAFAGNFDIILNNFLYSYEYGMQFHNVIINLDYIGFEIVDTNVNLMVRYWNASYWNATETDITFNEFYYYDLVADNIVFSFRDIPKDLVMSIEDNLLLFGNVTGKENINLDPTVETLIPGADGTYTEWYVYPSGSQNGVDYKYVDSCDGDRTGWIEVGDSPYLDAIDDTNKIYTASNGATEGDFGFQNSTRSSDYTITSVEVELYAYQERTLEEVRIYIWDGNSWEDIGSAQPEATYSWKAYGDASLIIDTWAEVNSTEIYVAYYKSGQAGNIHVDAMRLKIAWSKGQGSHYDKVDDPVGNPDDGSTYVHTVMGISGDSNWINDTYNLPNSTIPSSATITNFTVFIRGKAYGITAQPSYTIMIRTHDTDYLGDVYSGGGNVFADHTYSWSDNPYTESSWTIGEINTTEIGTRGKSAYYYVTEYWFPAIVTQIYANVSYTIGEEEEFDCNYIGLNTTLAGSITEIKADWTDLNASKGLSHNRFCWNNTGTFVNDTWTDTWNGNWSERIKTLNSTVNLVICARFYVNDTSGEEHASTWLFFTTYLPPDQHPVAVFFFTPPNPRRNENVTFNATESFDPDGTIVSYAWDFGDGDTGSGMILNHTFAYDEAYNVTLTVTDDDSLTGVCIESITPSATDSRIVVWGVLGAIIIFAIILFKKEGYI